MLQFSSASTRTVNTYRGVCECLEASASETVSQPSLLVFHSGLGHSLAEIQAHAKALAPQARVVGASCMGIVGREGVSETMKDMAVMAVSGDEFAVAYAEGVEGARSFAAMQVAAADLRRQAPGINMIYLMTSGIDVANDACIAAIESVFGPEVTIFGGSASDNMTGLGSFQSVDEKVMRNGAFLVGFHDPSLVIDTEATHGFVAIGEPLLVTESRDNHILMLNGRPAWSEYLSRLGLAAGATCADSLPIGALAEKLPEKEAAVYGSEHILRVVSSHQGEALCYPTECPAGTELRLTVQDERKIFDQSQRVASGIVDRHAGHELVAVFQADCLARGKSLFARVLKEELISRIQHPFVGPKGCPPWLGLYGLGEFARLDGRNTFHNYTTALQAIYRVR